MVYAILKFITGIRWADTGVFLIVGFIAARYSAVSFVPAKISAERLPVAYLANNEILMDPQWR